LNIAIKIAMDIAIKLAINIAMNLKLQKDLSRVSKISGIFTGPDPGLRSMSWPKNLGPGSF